MSELNIENVEFVLEKIRPYLKIDGGNVELVKIKKDEGIVEVCLTGDYGQVIDIKEGRK